MNKTERLRFAPSPTGDLHVGGARAALFNWLYARKTGGKFLLRIEDTDRERSTGQALESILESLRWLGLDWDEEPVFQSRRSGIYRDAVDRLLGSGAAYPCFCTKEDLEAERERAVREKLDYHYSGKCRNLGHAEVEALRAGGRPFTVRFRVPDGVTSFTDLVHGMTSFQNETIGDFIIARQDGSPVYLLGVAVDDADMGITLVMRGDDHISNTPKQIMLMAALGAEIPRFSHLPQVLGQDKKKLSKRHGAASVIEYRAQGFLSAALVNFLALLGWNPGDDREKMTTDELVDAFAIEGIARKSGVFDMQKLEWLNGQYLNDLPPEDLLDEVGRRFAEAGLVNGEELDGMREYLLTVIRLLQPRCRLVTEFVEIGAYFFREPGRFDEKGVRKHFTDEGAARLDELAEEFEGLGMFTGQALEDATRALAERKGIKWASYIHPTRLAVSGLTGGPGLFEMLEVLGRDAVVARMRRASVLIREGNVPS